MLQHFDRCSSNVYIIDTLDQLLFQMALENIHNFMTDRPNIFLNHAKTCWHIWEMQDVAYTL